MRSWKDTLSGLRLPLAVIVIVALTIGGIGAAQWFDRPTPGERGEPKPATQGAGKSKDEMKPASTPLALGTVARISPNYRAAVMEISRYESAGGAFIVATVKAEYTGKETGEVWADLVVEFSDTKAQTQGESSCRIDLGDGEPSKLPALKPGDEHTYGVCIDLAGSKLTGGNVSIEEALVSGSPARWSTEGAVSKPMPEPVPEARSEPTSAAQRQQPTEYRGGDDMCEKYADDVEEFKEESDEREEWLERYKQYENDDEKVEEYEEWLELMEQRIERYDAIC